jgi:hypothetical protein
MICEVEINTFKPGMVGKWLAGFCEALPSRLKYSALGGVWHTDIGPLNESVQIWPYDSFEHRDDVQTQLASDPNWPSNGNDDIIERSVQIFEPATFSAQIGSGQKLGSIYEMRVYGFRTGSMPVVIDRFEQAFKGGRLDLSPPPLFMTSLTGKLDLALHIWPYESYAARDKTRAATKNLSTWPADIGEFLLNQQNRILIPAACSPMA